MSTRAVDVSIHAVSPALNLSPDTSAGALSTGAAGAAAEASAATAEEAVAASEAPEAVPEGSSAYASGAHKADISRNKPIRRLIIPSLPLNCTRVPLAGPDPHDLRQCEHKDFSVAHLSRVRRLLDRLYQRLQHGIGYRDFYFCLRNELDDVFGAAVDLRMTTLPSESTHLGHGDPLHADVADGLAHLVQLEGFDDGGHELHGMPFAAMVPSKARARWIATFLSTSRASGRVSRPISWLRLHMHALPPPMCTRSGQICRPRRLRLMRSASRCTTPTAETTRGAPHRPWR